MLGYMACMLLGVAMVRSVGGVRDVAGAEGCGFSLPGSSALWAHHAKLMRPIGQHVAWDIAVGGMGGGLPAATLHKLQGAVAHLDRNETTAIEVGEWDTARARELRGYMVPFVQRGCGVGGPPLGPGAVDMGGTLKYPPPSPSGSPCFLKDYYGGKSANATLQRYLAGRVAGASPGGPHRGGACHPYWVRCVEAPGAGLPPAWAWASALVSRDIAARWGGAHQSRACLRVARGDTRLPFHIDDCGNTLYAISGMRRVLLSPPHLSVAFYPGQIAGEGRHATTSPIDPRDPHVLDTYPLARELWMLAVTLRPGDALHIPTAWWHYVETAPGHAPASMGLNVFEVEHGGFRKHQCVPPAAGR